MKCVELRGRDYAELGELGVVASPGLGALALSRGLYPKPYAHVDPNEDAALLYGDAAGRLLAVVDGRHGAFASECTLDHVRAAAPELIRAADLVPFEARVRALLAELAPALRAGRYSQTCLLMAGLVGTRCHFASFGDCALLRGSQKQLVSSVNDLVIGPEIAVRLLPPELWLGSLEVEAGERIALVTDGVTNFHRDPEHLTRSLRESEQDLEAARRLAEDAMRGGAGDNVAVAAATA